MTPFKKPVRLLSRWRRRADDFYVDVIRVGPDVVGCMVPEQDGIPCAYFDISMCHAKNPEAAAAQWARKTAQAGRDRFLMEFHRVHPAV